MGKPFKVGDKVRINHPHGSYAEITHVRTDGPFASEPRYYVTYHYGLNVRGEPITERGALSGREVVPVSEQEFASVANGRAFGKEAAR